jgi:hypothetical protein
MLFDTVIEKQKLTNHVFSHFFLCYLESKPFHHCYGVLVSDPRAARR